MEPQITRTTRAFFGSGGLVYGAVQNAHYFVLAYYSQVLGLVSGSARDPVRSSQLDCQSKFRTVTRGSSLAPLCKLTLYSYSPLTTSSLTNNSNCPFLLAFDPFSHVFFATFGVVDTDHFFGLSAILTVMVSPLFAQILSGTAPTAEPAGVIVMCFAGTQSSVGIIGAQAATRGTSISGK